MIGALWLLTVATPLPKAEPPSLAVALAIAFALLLVSRALSRLVIGRPPA
jgi:hypothetical protein